jgi:excisionase family DNA binding protein
MTDERYITVEEAAALLQVSTRQVHRYGGGEHPRLRTRKTGRRILFHRDDVETLARELSSTFQVPEYQPTTSDPLLEGELLSLQEAAQYAGLEKSTLHNYAKRGRLRAKRLGPIWVTTRAAIDAYLASRNQKHIPIKHRRIVDK